jgi:hypothetical protein
MCTCPTLPTRHPANTPAACSYTPARSALTMSTVGRVQALFAAHYVQGSACTALLAHRRTSPATETKPGKAPKNVDYIGAHSLAQVCAVAAAACWHAHCRVQVPMHWGRKTDTCSSSAASPQSSWQACLRTPAAQAPLVWFVGCHTSQVNMSIVVWRRRPGCARAAAALLPAVARGAPERARAARGAGHRRAPPRAHRPAGALSTCTVPHISSTCAEDSCHPMNIHFEANLE